MGCGSSLAKPISPLPVPHVRQICTSSHPCNQPCSQCSPNSSGKNLWRCPTPSLDDAYKPADDDQPSAAAPLDSPACEPMLRAAAAGDDDPGREPVYRLVYWLAPVYPGAVLSSAHARLLVEGDTCSKAQDTPTGMAAHVSTSCARACYPHVDRAHTRRYISHVSMQTLG